MSLIGTKTPFIRPYLTDTRTENLVEKSPNFFSSEISPDMKMNDEI